MALPFATTSLVLTDVFIHIIIAVFMIRKVYGQGLEPCIPDIFPGNKGFCLTTNHDLEVCGALSGKISQSSACRAIYDGLCCYTDDKPAPDDRRHSTTTSCEFEMNRNVRTKPGQNQFRPPKLNLSGQARRTDLQTLANHKAVTTNSVTSQPYNELYNTLLGSVPNPNPQTGIPTIATGVGATTNTPVTVGGNSDKTTKPVVISTKIPQTTLSSSLTSVTPPANETDDPNCLLGVPYWLHIETTHGDVRCHDDTNFPTGITITNSVNCSQMYFVLSVFGSGCDPGPCFNFTDNSTANDPTVDYTNYVHVDTDGVVRGSLLTTWIGNTVIQCYIAVGIINDFLGHPSQNRIAFCIRVQGYQPDQNSTCPKLVPEPCLTEAFANGEAGSEFDFSCFNCPGNTVLAPDGNHCLCPANTVMDDVGHCWPKNGT